MAPITRSRAERNRKPREHKQHLISMPLDVFIEIFLFLEPLDLLHLARTTRGLRAFLLNRSKSSALWKNAISNVEDFPPCPDHISAPAYTHLAFVPVCHGCFCPCETVEWELRMRCCPSCFPNMTISIPSSLRHTTYSYLNYLPIARHHYILDNSRGLDVVVTTDNTNLVGAISLLDWQVIRSRKRPKGVSEKQFLAQQNNFWGSILDHAHVHRNWEHRRLTAKAIQLSIVKRLRIEGIRSRLKELGWTEVPFGYRDDFLRLPQVGKLEPLTPTEWTEIRPQLIGWLQNAKEESFCHHFLDTYDRILVHVGEKLRSDRSLKVRPRGIDIAALPAVRSMVKNSIDPDMSDDNLKQKLFRVLPRAIRKWSTTAVEELEQLARDRLALPPLSKPSRLPSVIFRCTVCHKRLRFDEALSHQHLYKEKRGKRRSIGEPSIYDKLLMRYDIHPRSIQVLRVDIVVSRRVENLVRRIGQNPSRVTYDELCYSTVDVACGLCRPKVATEMCFEWAFEHCLDAHLGKKETEVWTRVSTRK